MSDAPGRVADLDRPWSVPTGLTEIRMVAPRSSLPVAGRYLLIAVTLLSIRFTLLGAWPVLIFAVLDIGALAMALYVFGRGQVPEERAVSDGGRHGVVTMACDESSRQARSRAVRLAGLELLATPPAWDPASISNEAQKEERV